MHIDNFNLAVNRILEALERLTEAVAAGSEKLKEIEQRLGGAGGTEPFDTNGPR